MLDQARLFNLPKLRSKTRDERRKERSNNYLGGKARKAFSHTPSQCGETTEVSSSLLDQRGNICSKYLPTLSRFADMFMELNYRGSNLKIVKLNPSPIRPDGKTTEILNAKMSGFDKTFST